MEIPNLIRKLSGLLKLATGQKGKPEGDNARRQMDRILSKSEVSITDDMLKSHEAFCEGGSEWDGDIAKLVASMTNTEAFPMKGGRVRFRGSRVSVEEAEKHYTQQRDEAYRTSAYAIFGYLQGAFGEAFEEYIHGLGASEAVKTGADENKKDQAERSRIEEAFSEPPTDSEARFYRSSIPGRLQELCETMGIPQVEAAPWVS